MEPLGALENAIGADLLRSQLLRAPLPRVGDRYSIQGFLGRGATGLVVSALDTRLGRSVALKLGIAGADSAMLVEARALASLDHPNVVHVHDVDVLACHFDGRPFRLWIVSMQMVPGQTMRAWISTEAPNLRRILRVFVDAGRGLAAAHEARIVHRDFKLDNVIVRKDGVAQVLDFGFAVPAPSAYSHLGSTQVDVAGTDPYMAPEARLGRANRRSDQFSFGVAIVEALTGEPRPARGRAPAGIPADVWSVLRRATDNKADKRYPSMTGVLVGLERALRGSERARGCFGPAALLLMLLTASVGLWRVWPAPWVEGSRHARRSLESLLAEFSSSPPMRARPHAPVRGPSGDQVPARPTPAPVASAVTAPAAPEGSGEVPEAPLRAAPDSVAPTNCISLDGDFVLTTYIEPPRRDIASVGSYALTLRGGYAQLTKRFSGRDDRHFRRIDERLSAVTQRPDGACGVYVQGSFGSRVYVFHLRPNGLGLSGTFEANGDRLGAFSGRVTGTRRPQP